MMVEGVLSFRGLGAVFGGPGMQDAVDKGGTFLRAEELGQHHRLVYDHTPGHVTGIQQLVEGNPQNHLVEEYNAVQGPIR